MAANTQAAVSIADLEAVAQAAMGLDTNGNPLPGNEETHKALAEAVKRLSAVQAATAAAQGGESSSSASIATPTKDSLAKKPTEYSRTTGNYASVPSRSTPQQGSTSTYSGSQQQFDADGTPVKRFQCHLCERAFARAYNLNTHLATHDPDPAKSKPFPCPYPSCKSDGGRSFSRKHDLQRHVASTHEHEPIPDDEEEIDENGVRVSQLAKLGLSTPGRKFRCEECGRAFVRRDALKRHQCMPMPLDHTGPNGEEKSSASTQPSSASSSPAPNAPAGANGIRNGEDLYSNAMPSGLSLYTSTTPQPGQPARKPAPTAAQPKGEPKQELDPPFYPSSITYESLTREVQDMAMHLVAQATKYNQAHSEGGPEAKSEGSVPGKGTKT
ncbi:uncharacterized protein FA14DRAFT_76063 [Meira miltonrushii]|uniref:C2H2-type domain-containing protein n=1 Tax=Meira miltonrushii TaxID=1280837 RepID=A0A316V4X1_9BASI|nr:uncharacterized protein FA14DRAFT_76063 [Meira miltonrushii]PWN32607.1 hypothetical protein FA14DRAFT_76063 [Meira miltonrushii]